MLDKRPELEVEQILSDIRLKNRQHATEIWKVVLLSVAVTATAVQAANIFFGPHGARPAQSAPEAPPEAQADQ